MKSVRCAIYTRKSSEEGLDQTFNSLDAQREACAAYILSQASEGWVALPDIYDDGGLSGGTLDRPALQRLLSEVKAGRVDTIVVYKVDRLTRSLMDFSRLVETFDAAGTSFVSVTQSFNTTTSMGRLTLNMLLSFAQFEREVTAERIRDKIAASKARGMWMGGTPPLGYEPDGRSLKIVGAHAEIIRQIFDFYLELGNVRLVATRLEQEGVRSPTRVRAKTGIAFGGVTFSRGQIYGILQCPTYVGEVHHRDQIYPGLHKGIVDRGVWDRTQEVLAGNLQGHRSGARAASPSLLAGKLVDAAGRDLITSHANKGSTRYRYYVSRDLHEGTASKGMRLPAREIEAVVRDQIAALFDDAIALIAAAWLKVSAFDLATLTERCADVGPRSRATVRSIVHQVRVHDSRIDVVCSTAAIATTLGVEREDDAPDTITIQLEIRLTRSGRAMRLIRDSGAPVIAAPNPSLIRLLIKARRWWATLREGEVDIKRLAQHEGVQSAYVTRVLRLAFLSPAVVNAILDGRQTDAAGVTELTLGGGFEANWAGQKQRLVAAL